MSDIKNILKTKKNLVIVFIGLLTIGSVGGYFVYNNRLNAMIMSKMIITFTDVKEIEYGTKDFDVKKNLIKKLDNAKLKDIPSIDTYKVGDVKLTFTLVKKDVIKKVNHFVRVVDTKGPEIILENTSKEITVGDNYDIKSNIKSVKDQVDGDIEIKQESMDINKKATEEYNKLKSSEINNDIKIQGRLLKEYLIEDTEGKKEKNLFIKNCYYIDGSVNTQKVGEYKSSIIAVDKNGVKTSQGFTIVVKEKVKDLVAGTHSNNDKKNPNNQTGQANINKKGINAVVSTALSQIGVPYVWGGITPSGFDCSGLIYWAFQSNGYSIPRAVRSAGKSLGTNMGKAQIGDIIVTPNHVSLVTEKKPLDYLHEGMVVYTFRFVEATTDRGVQHSSEMFPLMVRSDGAYIGTEGQVNKGNCLDIRRVR